MRFPDTSDIFSTIAFHSIKKIFFSLNILENEYTVGTAPEITAFTDEGV